MKKGLGFCLGASSVSVAIVEYNGKGFEVKQSSSVFHQGDPKAIFTNLLEKYYQNDMSIVVTGRKFRSLVALETISEPEATETAFLELIPDHDAFTGIASLGGETFLAYTLDNECRINNVVAKNQCASGTGEFFLQQIKRMDLTVEETIEIAKDANPYKVSGRCSVFCKSDCTHALNKGTPKSEVAAGLAYMISEKIDELLNKVPKGKILILGGVTRNAVVMNFVKESHPNIFIPENANSFEAIGAAIYGIKKDIKPLSSLENIIIEKSSSFSYHQALENFANKVTFKPSKRSKAFSGQRCILGLDVGSTTTKAVVISEDGAEILADVYLYTNGNPIAASRECYARLMQQLPDDINIVGIGTTGSGRQISGIHALTEGVVNEIVAHATAAVFFDDEVDTLFEIGGQDAKYTYIVNKVPADYAMNEACSAGTGSFIEESAYETLGIKVTEIESIAMNGMKPPNFSDQCAAFISSDIKTALQEGISKDDIVAGLVYSICLNYVNRVKGNRTIGKKIFMQGGVCYNKAIPIAMAALTGADIIVPPDPGLMGAFGVALVVRERLALGLMDEGQFDLQTLAGREVTYRKPFICYGGKEKCDRRCSVNIIEIEGKKLPFGGACNKYYNLKGEQSFDYDKYDYVKRRHLLTFDVFAPERNLGENPKRVGLNASFHTFTLYPLFYNFFNLLGFEVVMPDEIDSEGIERENTSFCYPAQLSLGLFKNLIDKAPDFYFVPTILEMLVDDSEYQRLDFNCTCVFVSGEAMYLKQAYKDLISDKRILSPNLNFGNGYLKELKHFVQIGLDLGVSAKAAEKAYLDAIEMQNSYQNELLNLGKEALEEIYSQPDNLAIVLVGRPYNAFTDIANKGIPRKFASRGIYVLPNDIFDLHDDKVDDNMYWEGGKKILKSAKFIKRDDRLFATYISNFSCGPDSMILSSFREIMGTKPSLTLELDGHTADAGINTRIDAAIDVIKNYIKLKSNISDPDNSDFKSADVEFGKDGNYYITSDGERIPMNDPRVKILIPSMGDLNSEVFAAAFRSLGFNAHALPPSNPDIIKYGKAVSSGKECLPLIILAGSLSDYIENQKKEEYVAFFTVEGAGNCRLGQYPVFLRQLIKSKKWRNVTQITLMNEDGFAGFGSKFAMRAIQAIMIGDVLDDVRSAIMAYAKNPALGVKVFDSEFKMISEGFERDPDNIYKLLENFAEAIHEKVAIETPIEKARYVALLGEIYVRRDLFSHKYLNEIFAKKGFVLKIGYISEWIYYVDYLLKIGLLEPENSIRKKLEREIRHYFMRSAEKKIKKALSKSGYYKYSLTDIKPLLEHSKHIIPLDFKGEPGLTLGISMYETLEKYCGIINLGPFGCMPTRFTEAVSIPEMTVERKIAVRQEVEPNFKLSALFNGKMSIPFLTIEVDGNVFPQVIEARLEAFTLQAERTAQIMEAAKNGNKS
ncbi:MAG: activase [Ignavibacteriae bacterium HGW-Ignavibacteriae-1]|nr:MAG: activase [Ignavibacteriae bacterium HGW-Ignavibacteriae-1]